MSSMVFESRRLPDEVAEEIRTRIAAAHAREPFSPLEPRAAARRLQPLLQDLRLSTRVYRGELGLRGAGIDHLWLEVSGDPVGGGYVVDAAFPLFVDAFVAALRRFVAGDAEPGELVTAAAAAGVDTRVVGEFPRTVRYRGVPVWGARD